MLVLWACDGGGSSPKPDGSISTMVDARPVDAAVPIDAPVDADNSAVTAACVAVCDALAACAMEPGDPTCATECAADLADCTPQQVQAVDACKTEACGDESDSPLLRCIVAVSCVQM
jgi:hypothetical protein